MTNTNSKLLELLQGKLGKGVDYLPKQTVIPCSVCKTKQKLDDGRQCPACWGKGFLWVNTKPARGGEENE